MYWAPYVPVAERREKAQKKIDKLKKQGKTIEPVEISGKSIARFFWGIQWCDHVESLSDFESRLSRGKTYVRNGSICHLAIEKGSVDAMVVGSELYKVSINIKTLAEQKWEAIKKQCSGQISTLLDFLQGKVPESVMKIVADPREGLFPSSKEISFNCNCPDWAGMCKHVAAVLYGIGNRLDNRPELLFHLRGVDPSELISTDLDLTVKDQSSLLDGSDLSALFDIDLDSSTIQTNEQMPNHQQEIEPPAKKPRKNPSKKQTQVSEKMDINSLTGKNLYKFRLKNNWTVAEFADKLEVTTASIYRWEASSTVLNLRTHAKTKLAILFNES